ncbi:SDR family NAD(P)-dependent oxidoreductase [Clostridium sartagoforme]|uniref:SDR family NAD(P)-dependent oxidoreductase n=1 Tax=Clostridium sartagoforme TaxID=84031 RepID=A0A4S2DQZ4_9CLOT|nr:SDR family NAD(P)-dependent oxidoreductase [Clostridium sartagoforme]TGY44302.1 SDR family NAD(P)-dependent oxidoreductase [Clostridium sartagoforme]
MEYALITGATKGIGKAFAKKLASENKNLILVARSEDLLKELKESLELKFNVDIVIFRIDLSKLDEVNSLIKELDDYEIDMLINNAGFGGYKAFADHDLPFNRDMEVTHNTSVIMLTHNILNKFKMKNKGIVLTVSSIVGFGAFPNLGIYCATKAFLNIFMETIYLENLGSNINIKCLCPGFVSSSFYDGIDIDKSLLKNKGVLRWMTPDEVVGYTIKNINKNKVILIPGILNKFLYVLLTRMPKKLYYKIANKNWEYLK